MKKNLALTGMMGVGKSAIGKVLSKKLHMKFVDIDKIIENKLKMTIPEIFKKKGELFFRKFEEEITLKIITETNTVISLGGGAFINSKIRRSILSNNISFWLDLNVDLLEQRLLKSKMRPLLANKNLKETLEKIYDERKSTYAMANFRINCDKSNINLTSNKIIKLYASN